MCKHRARLSRRRTRLAPPPREQHDRISALVARAA